MASCAVSNMQYAIRHRFPSSLSCYVASSEIPPRKMTLCPGLDPPLGLKELVVHNFLVCLPSYLQAFGHVSLGSELCTISAYRMSGMGLFNVSHHKVIA